MDSYVLSLMLLTSRTPLYKVMLGEIKEDGLKQAEEKGVYKSAEKNMKALINDSLDEITDYDVVYA